MLIFLIFLLIYATIVSFPFFTPTVIHVFSLSVFVCFCLINFASALLILSFCKRTNLYWSIILLLWLSAPSNSFIIQSQSSSPFCGLCVPTWTEPTTSLLSPNSFTLLYSLLVPLFSSLLLQHPKSIPTAGPLNILFSLARMRNLLCFLTSFRCHLNCHLFMVVFLGHPLINSILSQGHNALSSFPVLFFFTSIT